MWYYREMRHCSSDIKTMDDYYHIIAAHATTHLKQKRHHSTVNIMLFAIAGEWILFLLYPLAKWRITDNCGKHVLNSPSTLIR